MGRHDSTGRAEPRPIVGGRSRRGASIDTGVADRDAHLRSADFLHTEEFPEIVFTSRRVEAIDQRRYHVVGDLTLRDVTREVALEVEYAGSVRDPSGHLRAGFSASCSLDRTDFGLTWNQVLEQGAIFFEPVRIGDVDYIDGGVGSVAHVDVAIARGAERILVVNPIVPVRNVPGRARLPSRHGCNARMRDKGLLYLAGQAWGIANRARLHSGIRGYLGEHPGVEVLLIEPSEEETVMFLSNSMSFRTRREILDYARTAARKALADTFRGGLRITELGAHAPPPVA